MVKTTELFVQKYLMVVQFIFENNNEVLYFYAIYINEYNIIFFLDPPVQLYRDHRMYTSVHFLWACQKSTCPSTDPYSVSCSGLFGKVGGQYISVRTCFLCRSNDFIYTLNKL